MKDVRIVIVSWNVEALLERCLRSLPDACAGLDWECVVVDNASSDKSVEIAERVSNEVPEIRIMANPTNDGFAKGCNKGVEQSDARYVLFLNPDTECPPHSLTRLVHLATERSKAGILGPKLIYADGCRQPSVRRFPTVWSQLGILLKLHHVMRWLPMFRRYFMDDFDYEEEQVVDQVMGACFLVRKELVDAKLGFDERYFVWMEEVDFCLTAKRAGWDVVYLPQTAIIHHGGQSFAQVFTLKKQRYFNDSTVKYFAKWHHGWRSDLIEVATWPALGLAWLAGAAKTSWGPWAALVLGLEAVSAFTVFHPVANTLACVAAGIAMLIVAKRRPELGLAALALELVIGSKGYLLQLGGWPSHVSLRVILTAAFLFGWAVNALAARRIGWTMGQIRKSAPYAFLAALVVMAVLRGAMAGYPDLVADANSWFFLILLLPVWDVAARLGAPLRKAVVPALVVGVIWLATKTLLVELLFSHQAPHIYGIYLWIRRTGIGEVTRLAGSFFRVFFQSHVYLLAAWLMAAAYSLRKGAKPAPHFLDRWVLALSTGGLFLGMSRSFAIGAVAGAVMLAVLAYRQGNLRAKAVMRIASASFYGLIIAGAVVLMPLPGVSMVSPLDLLDSRLNDAAAQSRWELLPAMWEKIKEAPILGSGFGATVTYHTFDPRLVEQGAADSYTTYAFEWGWLEHWIKFGIFGPIVIAWILILLGRRLWKLDEPMWLRSGAVASLAALATLHVFTPYLNHPLGFLFLLLGEGMILSSQGSERI